MINYRSVAQAADINAIADACGLQVNSRNKARCPFHDDRRPSMQLYSDGHYHCFVCGAHGDAIDLVQYVNKCGKREAAEMVARISGGEVCAMTAIARRRATERKQAYKQYDVALRRYQAAEVEQAHAKQRVAEASPFSAEWEQAQAEYLHWANCVNNAEERLIQAEMRRNEIE